MHKLSDIGFLQNTHKLYIVLPLPLDPVWKRALDISSEFECCNLLRPQWRYIQILLADGQCNLFSFMTINIMNTE